MLTILALASFVIAAVAALVSLVDSSLIARQAAEELMRERALLRMGFVPQIAAPVEDLRPRPAALRAWPTRTGGLTPAVRARALPLRFAVPPSDAA